MTVAELIEKLKTYPPDAVPGYLNVCCCYGDCEMEVVNIVTDEYGDPLFTQ